MHSGDYTATKEFHALRYGIKLSIGSLEQKDGSHAEQENDSRTDFDLRGGRMPTIRNFLSATP